MKKSTLLFCSMLFISCQIALAQGTGVESRMNEVFQVTELTAPSGTNGNTRFYDPWEITYGPDDSLWITEAKNYRVYKMGLNGGVRRMILDISPGSTFLPAGSQSFNLSFPTSYSSFTGGGYSGGSAPQGGLAGLAIHPQFLSGSPYVFVSYIWKFVKHLNTKGQTVTATATSTVQTSTTTPANGGVYYQNSLVRFTYNFTTGTLGSPVAVCDTLPGSSDHNSQRIIIAPVNGTYYLFYANGDMGAGQFGNAARVENAQNYNSYEGKILRFNLDPDADAGAYDKWIPGDNPYNTTLGKQSAVWAIGFRNNQGFAYAKINGTDYLYGQMHGPFSDDELNIIQKAGNYGHPLVVGYACDGNYNSAAAGDTIIPTGTNQTYGGGLPVVTNELTTSQGFTDPQGNKNYHDPIFTFYPAVAGSTTNPQTQASGNPINSVQYMYSNFIAGNQSNTYWPSEAPSGLDIYTNSMIPGWKNSLISGVMKGAPFTLSGATGASGKLMRLKLNSNGDGLFVAPVSGTTLQNSSVYSVDTVSYFNSVNRFRDLAISPDGLSLYTIIDSSSVTSGPTATNPINSLCKGCLLKMTFLGYSDNGTTSTLPDTIAVATGATNSCINANTITINSANNNVWVPITDTNSNIIAEINANGNNLGTVTTSYYLNGNAVRETSGYTHGLYLDRNITITPATQPSSAVKVRLYFTNAEFTALVNARNSANQPSGVSTVAGLTIYKNHDLCSSAMTSTPTGFAPTYTHTRTSGASSNGYVVQTSISSFSTFYFASNTTTLALHLLSFTGSLVNNITQLQWITETESGTKNYVVERSVDGTNFNAIGTVTANNTASKSTYNFPDPSVSKLSCTVVYYRLRIVEADGSNSFSDVVPIDLPGVAGSMVIHPNPVINTATIEINAAVTENANWQMVDNTGRSIQQKNILLTKGANTFTINVSNLPTGVYYLIVTGTVINQQVKFEKL